MINKKNMHKFIFAIAILIALFLAALLFVIENNESPNIVSTPPTENSNDISSEGKVCTMDAKLCADGSYVSRTGPNCEFLPCPVKR